MSGKFIAFDKIINKYFDLWRSQNTEGLEDIFAENAAYHVKPFGEEEHYGIDAIKSYWLANPVKKQISPSPQILNLAYADNKAFIEWVNVFTTLEGSRKESRGIMILEINDGLIVELREFYKSKEENS